MLLAASGQANAGTPSGKPFIGKQEISIQDGRMTPEALWAMGRIGDTEFVIFSSASLCHCVQTNIK